MRIDGFATGWDEDRRPMPDEGDDALRRARYWQWSERFGPDLGPDDAPRIAAASDGRSWHRLLDEGHADFEAFHMRHSIGYNWDHYSGMGEILSLRADGVPQATVLVAGGVVVHARRPANAPLEPSDLAMLVDLAAAEGWRIADPSTL
jgi:hypothetical protein